MGGALRVVPGAGIGDPDLELGGRELKRVGEGKRREGGEI